MCILGSEMKFFNGFEWKSISEYTEGDKVLQYNNDGTAELAEPTYFCKTGSHESLYKLGVDCPDLVVLYAGIDTLLPTTQGERIRVGNLIAHGEQIGNNVYGDIELITNYQYDGDIHLCESVIANIVYCLHNGVSDINGYVECRDGSVSLTNKIFELSLESKKMLLRTLGLREEGKSVYNVFGYDFELVNKLVSLWNSTYSHSIILEEEDEENGYKMLFTDSDLSGFGYINTFNRVPRSSGYHLDVPSGMVIVKADCGIPMVVCC